jgi:TetR/AcrR family tetracycline transcriptional repressor
VDAALAYVRSTGFEKLTIRGLSAQLNVAPMSLYRHVRDKDDLLDEVVDRLLAGLMAPLPAPGDWRRSISAAAEQLRDLLVREPAVRYVYLRHPVVSPAALQRMNVMLEVLHHAGFDAAAAERAYAAVQTYTIGFAALEASREGWRPPDTDVDPIATRLAAYTTPRQFAEGLNYLLDGIERSN